MFFFSLSVSLYLSISYALSPSLRPHSLCPRLSPRPLSLASPSPPPPPAIVSAAVASRRRVRRRWERAVRRAWRGRWRCQSTGSAQYQLTTRATCRASLSPPPPPSSAALAPSLICRPLSPRRRLSLACSCVLPAVLLVRGWAVAGRSTCPSSAADASPPAHPLRVPPPATAPPATAHSVGEL